MAPKNNLPCKAWSVPRNPPVVASQNSLISKQTYNLANTPSQKQLTKSPYLTSSNTTTPLKPLTPKVLPTSLSENDEAKNRHVLVSFEKAGKIKGVMLMTKTPYHYDKEGKFIQHIYASNSGFNSKNKGPLYFSPIKPCSLPPNAKPHRQGNQKILDCYQNDQNTYKEIEKEAEDIFDNKPKPPE